MTRWTGEQYANYLSGLAKKQEKKETKPRKKPEPSPTKGMDKPTEGFKICHSTMKKKKGGEEDA